MTLLMGMVLTPSFVLAVGNLDDALGNLRGTGQQAGVEANASLSDIIGTVINAMLSLVGIIFLVLMVYAGYLWMTARGEEEQVKKAQKIITTSIIGIVIVVSAYAITFFVTSRFG